MPKRPPPPTDPPQSPGWPYAPGMVGQAFRFDGGAKTGIDVPDSPTLALTNSLTLEAWIKITVPFDGMILFRGDDRGGLDPYAPGISTNSTQTNIGFSINPPTAQYARSAPVPVGQFVHVAGTLDGALGQMCFYVDGAVVAQGTTPVRPLGALSTSANPGLGIGNVQASPASPYSFPFHGLIDEVLIYSRALSAQEVLASYQAGPAGLGSVPVILVPPPSQTAWAGTSLALQVEAAGAEPLTYHWWCNAAGFSGQAQRREVQHWGSTIESYWRRFQRHLPKLLQQVGNAFGPVPLAPTAKGFWEQLLGHCGDLARATRQLVHQFFTCLFGTYRCHQPRRLHAQ